MNEIRTDRPDLDALSAWAPELAKTFVSLASDIALVIDNAGVICSVAQGGADPVAPGACQWIGRPWIDTVSGETRAKITNLLDEVARTGLARRREVNHPLGFDNSVSVAYTAIRLGETGPVLAVGRDLRAIAAIQKRYVESQQETERCYWQARQADTRYQLLFQVATDAVIVVDGETLAIIEANQAAAALLDVSLGTWQGRHIASAFEHHARGGVIELLGNARSTGQSGEIRARLQGTHASAGVVATPFRADNTMRLLVRLRLIETAGTSDALSQNLSRLLDSASDGVVVTDSSGRIEIANAAFMSLVGLSDEEDVSGRALMSWVSLTDQPLAALVAKVRRDGIARDIQSWVRRDGDEPVPVDISAALLTEGDQECIGFTLRPIEHAPGTQEVDIAADNALSQLLGAGIAALGDQLEPLALARVVREAAAQLGISVERLSQFARHGSDAHVEAQAGPSAS